VWVYALLLQNFIVCVCVFTWNGWCSNLLLRWRYSPMRTFASFLGFLTVSFLQWQVVSLSSNPQPGGPFHRIYNPRGRVAQLYPQALGTLFGRLLRPAWAAVGLFFSPVTTRGRQVFMLNIKSTSCAYRVQALQKIIIKRGNNAKWQTRRDFIRWSLNICRSRVSFVGVIIQFNSNLVY
jgi:hypothetical protein